MKEVDFWFIKVYFPLTLEEEGRETDYIQK